MNYKIKLTPIEIAEIVNGKLIGPETTLITNISRIENSKPGDLTFISRSDYKKYLSETEASCILVPEGIVLVTKPQQSIIECEDPYLSLVKILKLIVVSNSKPKKGAIHRSAIIDATAKVSKTAIIEAHCYIGANCVIGDGVVIKPNVVLYDNVIIGQKTEINSNVVCYSDTIIGSECIIHSGAVIGSDGFGFIENKEDGSYDKIPQLGNVVIGDSVEVGANATIDRALLDSTIIEDGVKIDNLVHIAHNCQVGKNSAMAAQVGISGSVKIGERNRLGGQVGLAGHLETADKVTVAAQSGVAKSIKEEGMYFGTPAKPKMTAFKIEACLRQLPDLIVDVEQLKKNVFRKEGKEK